MRSLARYSPFLAVLLLVAPDTSPSAPPEGCPGRSQEIPEGAIKVPLPEVIQPDTYSCGVACLMSILTYYGLEDETYADLRKQLGASKANGTDYKRIVKFAKKRGLSAEAKKDMELEALLKSLDDHKPVICSIQAWDEDRPAKDRPKLYKDENESGHFVVAIGYDKDNIFFMDPSLARRRGYLPHKEFEERWHDNEGTEDDPKVIRHLGLVIWKKGVNSVYPRCAQKIE